MHAMSRLHGERNSPELPVPYTKIESYARRHGLSGQFCILVSEYDTAMMAVSSAAHQTAMQQVSAKTAQAGRARKGGSR